MDSRSSRRRPLEHALGDVEVRVDVLDVVVVLELRRSGAGSSSPSASSSTSTVVFGTIVSSAESTVKPAASIASRTAGELLGAPVHLEGRAVERDVVRAALGRRERQLVLVDAVRRRRARRRAARTATRPRPSAPRLPSFFANDVAHVGGGAVAVVGQRLDDHRDAARRRSPRRRRSRTRPRRRRRPSPSRSRGRCCPSASSTTRAFSIAFCSARLPDGSPPALLRRDDDRARELREELAALRVGGALLVLDRRPLAMPGHSSPPVPGCRNRSWTRVSSVSSGWNAATRIRALARQHRMAVELGEHLDVRRPPPRSTARG